MCPNTDNRGSKSPARDDIRLSVVIPWHLHADLLRRAVQSVLAQTCPAHEIIVVCNGGRVHSDDVKGEFEDFPVKFLTQEKADAGAARNAGSDAAAGDYVSFLDVDDEFLPDKLETLADAVRSGMGGVLTHRGIRQRASGAHWRYPLKLLTPDDDLGKYFFSEGNLVSSSMIMAHANIAREIRFRERLNFDDADFIIRAQAAGYPVHMLPQSLFVWHDEESEGRMSRSRNHDVHLAWACSLGPLLSEQALAAFASRCIAQREFPKNFSVNIVRLYRGWSTGRIPLSSTAMMALRGLLPRSVEALALDAYQLLRHRTLR